MQKPISPDKRPWPHPGAISRRDLAHLHFLRWLAEQGRLEHAPAGPPSGPFAASAVPEAA